MSSNPNLASLIIPRNIRHPVLVVLVLIVIVFALHAFIRVPFNGSLGHGRSRSRDEIGMLTYNIWFSTEKMRERMEALGQIVEDLQPDILVFQEVTRENLAILEQQTWFSRYRLIPSDVKMQEKPHHFVIILIVYAVEKWFIHPFVNSPRMRKLVVAQTRSAVSPGVEFVVAGTHLVHAEENTIQRE